MKEQYLEVGKITNVHGIMGEVRVQPWADSPDFLCQFKNLYVDSSHWPIQVERARVHKNMVILKLQGVTDVNSALAMRNAVLYIDRKDVQLPEGSFFLADLMGMEGRDAASGAVVKFEKERDDDDAPSQGGNPGSAPAGDIGEARAKEAVMSHAGVAEADIRDYKIERDTDDGIGVYEIEFKAGGYEYDYEVKAADGAILKNQKEIDD